jgi:hypothetical protein
VGGGDWGRRSGNPGWEEQSVGTIPFWMCLNNVTVGMGTLGLCEVSDLFCHGLRHSWYSMRYWHAPEDPISGFRDNWLGWEGQDVSTGPIGGAVRFDKFLSRKPVAPFLFLKYVFFLHLGSQFAALQWLPCSISTAAIHVHLGQGPL